MSEIYKIYKENHVFNLENSLIKTENTKNVIYTFSSFLETFLNQFEEKTIESKFLGKISKKNIKEYKISAFEKETQIEKEIEDFYSNDELKIIIFKFNPKDLNKISSIIFFLIDNVEKEKSKKICYFYDFFN